MTSDIPSILDPVLIKRYRRLFRFYDRQGDGELNLESDFVPAAKSLAGRWWGRNAPIPNLLGVLIATYRHEQDRRDGDGSGSVDEDEFITSHGPVLASYRRNPEQAWTFIERAAGGFFDVLDLNQDGYLELTDLVAYAEAYDKPSTRIADNLARMLNGLGLPADQPRDRLSREAFLTLVTQYWFDPSPDAPGRWLFSVDPS